MLEALGLKISQFQGLMNDVPEAEEDRALATQVAAGHMKKIIEKLRGIQSSSHQLELV